MKSESLGGRDVPQSRAHLEMARDRVYLHPFRWTSLGLMLVEAMHLGMPVVGLATTEASELRGTGAGEFSNRIDVLRNAIRRFINDKEEAKQAGLSARA